MLKTTQAQVNTVTKHDYKQQVNAVRNDLLQLQHQALQQDKPVIIVIAGDDRSGRHETINTLCEWMDPRFISVNAYGPSQHQDNDRPFFWRFWRDLPGSGEIAIYLRDWTSSSIVQYLNGEISEKRLRKREQYINNFEQKHIDDGALIIKFWLHISEEELNKRVTQVHDTVFSDKKDKLALKHYPDAIAAIQRTLDATSTPNNHWHIIDGTHFRSRNLNVAMQIKQRLQQWLETTPEPSQQTLSDSDGILETPSLSTVPDTDLSEPQNFKKQLKSLQKTLLEQMLVIRQQDIPIVLAFEGWDAAGKGGAIRRLVSGLDAGFYRIKPIAKPTEEERAHHYLWRFWRALPCNGHMVIFDRSWYGRVLVERVEGFATENEWRRAYKEINDFEEQLTLHKTLVLKFWINISKDEQARRFEERESKPHKQYKITEEDYRNRAKWDEYMLAAEQMIAKTHTEAAPWHVVSTNDKAKARVQVLSLVVDALAKHIERCKP